MKADLGGYPASALEGRYLAQRAEHEGYDGFWAPEIKFDAMIGCAAAAVSTERVALGTGITVAFARSPMTVALQANDLQLLSCGRFLLGLGSQVQAHITRRYSMPWSHPAPRMREFIQAVRAIWRSWETAEPLEFRGDFYTHTLMTPFFNPGPNPHGNPAILLAGVGARMCEVAGEVADGLVCHGFVTERYLREVTLPAIARGRSRSEDGANQAFDISLPVLAIAADDDDEIERGHRTLAGRIGFYGSTPAYRPVLALHGWADLHEELRALAKENQWDQMADAIPAEVFDAFAVAGTPEDVVSTLCKRYGGIVSRITLELPSEMPADRRQSLLAQLREAAHDPTRSLPR